MEIGSKSIVGEIVRDDFRTASVFEEFGIDFCCGGNIPVDEACASKGLETSFVIEKLKNITINNDPDSSFINSLSLSQLCDYIRLRHHRYINEIIPFVTRKLQKLCDVHGENHPELYEVKALFNLTAGNLALHMKKEELLVFPYIVRIEKMKEGLIKTEKNPKLTEYIVEMTSEHDLEGERLKMINQLTAMYKIPPDGCKTYEVTYKTLDEFEKDLHRHIHLENNILFPKAKNTEKGILITGS